MFNHSKDLALFLEQMRTSRGISQENFTEGIISNRQYQRYISGSSAMPFHLLDDFAERLNVKRDFLLLEFDSYAIKETNNIIDLFNAVNSDDFETANKIDKEITPKYILDPSNHKLYAYSKLLQNLKTNKISRQSYITTSKELIDYAGIVNKSAFTMIETLLLSNMLDFLEENEQKKIFHRIKSFVDNPSLIWTGSEIITYNMLMFRMAKYAGLRNDFDSVIHFCKIAIALNYKSKYFLNLDYYFYFLALAYYRKNDNILFEENLYRCFTVLEMINSSIRTSNIISMTKKDFSIDFVDFATTYQKNKYKIKV